jgi:hypothetical protein
MKKLGLLEVSLFKLVVSGPTIHTLLQRTWLTRSFKRKNPAPDATAPMVQTIERLRARQPLTASTPGRMNGHRTARLAIKWLTVTTVGTSAPSLGHMAQHLYNRGLWIINSVRKMLPCTSYNIYGNTNIGLCIQIHAHILYTRFCGV